MRMFELARLLYVEIMTEFRLWERPRQRVIAFNLKQGVLVVEDTLVADTPPVETEATYGRQMKTCGHKEDCDCPKVPTDDNVGIVRKSNAVSYVGHKEVIHNSLKKIAVRSVEFRAIRANLAVLRTPSNDTTNLLEIL